VTAVITGVGVVSAFGIGTCVLFDGLAGDSGVVVLSRGVA
jgi:hypothetical protein